MVVQARTILWYYVFVGFAVNYMIRININIAIVDMVHQSISLSPSKISSECINNFSSISITQEFSQANSSQSSFIISDNSVTPSIESAQNFSEINEINERTGYDWNEHQQGLILGAFFWMHWATQMPGGILAKKYGTKLIFGLSNAIACGLCVFVPIVSQWDYKALIALRLAQGFISGFAWPSMHNMVGQWIPPNERSKFVTAYIGSSVGISVFYPLFGYIISWLSWEWIFYFCGVIGTMWYILWVIYVFDSPSTHPRIAAEERNYIESSLAGTVQFTPVRGIPWKAILTSRVVWLNTFAMTGNIWALFTLMTQGPTYLKFIHGWNIEMTGVISGLPHIMRVIFAYYFSTFGDYMLKSGKMSRSNVRKLATFVCCTVNGFLMLALAYSGCHSTLAIVLLTLGTAVQGSVTTGPLASMVDASPNYASIVFGISNTISVLPGFISPAIVGYLTLGNQTITSWKYVFLIAAAMLIICGTVYVLFCETKIQSWNTPPQKTNDKELAKLNEVKECSDLDTKYTFSR